MNLDPIAIKRMTGSELFHRGDVPIGANLLAFWQWAYSDLVTNTCRGAIAEFLVASALGLTTGLRAPWYPYDLKTVGGTTIEVKSASLLQRWRQVRLSPVSFSIRETCAEDPETAAFARDRKRQADIYVFALLSHTDKATLNPLEVNQWTFYIVSTLVLNEKCQTAKTISLTGLRRLGAIETKFEGLAAAVGGLAEQSAT